MRDTVDPPPTVHVFSPLPFIPRESMPMPWFSPDHFGFSPSRRETFSLRDQPPPPLHRVFPRPLWDPNIRPG
jgi:hypothetical protein